jgi:hypothetical protein
MIVPDTFAVLVFDRVIDLYNRARKKSRRLR